MHVKHCFNKEKRCFATEFRAKLSGPSSTEGPQMELVFLWLGCAVAATWIGVAKGRSGLAWAMLGLLFGLFALIVVACLPRRIQGPAPETHVKCPDCKELVLREARVCKHCRCRLVPV